MFNLQPHFKMIRMTVDKFPFSQIPTTHGHHKCSCQYAATASHIPSHQHQGLRSYRLWVKPARWKPPSIKIVYIMMSIFSLRAHYDAYSLKKIQDFFLEIREWNQIGHRFLAPETTDLFISRLEKCTQKLTKGEKLEIIWPSDQASLNSTLFGACFHPKPIDFRPFPMDPSSCLECT